MGWQLGLNMELIDYESTFHTELLNVVITSCKFLLHEYFVEL